MERVNNQKIRLLIVDDNPGNLQLLGNFLRKLEYSVEFATNSEEALNWSRREVFDLLMLDIEMPGMDGYELCRTIKRVPDYAEIPIIFLSVRDDVESTVKGFEAGAVDYIKKPYNFSELKARVSTHVQLKRSRDILISCYTEIDMQNKQIMESIAYAERIQKSMLPGKAQLKKILGEYFLIYRPRDIISGDFYWIRKLGSKFLLAVVDCTGHGVPGAMMSIIGYTALNEAVNEYGYRSTKRIVEHMDNYVKKALQKYSPGRIGDGMDIGLCLVDPKGQTIQFTCANTYFTILRNGEFIEFKKDAWSVGDLYPAEKQYRKQQFIFHEEDILLMYTDGIIDQFGGDRNKKLSRNRLKKAIKTLNFGSVQEMGEGIEEMFLRWKGKEDQVDDVTLLSMKLATEPVSNGGPYGRKTLQASNS